MKSKIKAFRVPEAALKGDRMLNYGEMCDNEQEMIPVNMRPAKGIGYHVLEDVRGNVFILKDKYVVENKLDKRPLGKVQSDYLKPNDYDNQQELPLDEQPENSGEEIVETPSEKTMEKLAEIRERSEKKKPKKAGQKKKSTVKSKKEQG